MWKNVTQFPGILLFLSVVLSGKKADLKFAQHMHAELRRGGAREAKNP